MRHFLPRAWPPHQPPSSSDCRLQLCLWTGITLTRRWCLFAWRCKSRKVDPACRGNDGGFPLSSLKCFFFLAENKSLVWCWDGLPPGSTVSLRLPLPLRRLNSRKGEVLLQAPWGWSLRGRQASSSSPSLLLSVHHLPNSFSVFVFLSPCSIVTNYSFSCLLLLIKVFFSSQYSGTS